MSQKVVSKVSQESSHAQALPLLCEREGATCWSNKRFIVMKVNSVSFKKTGRRSFGCIFMFVCVEEQRWNTRGHLFLCDCFRRKNVFFNFFRFFKFLTDFLVLLVEQYIKLVLNFVWLCSIKTTKNNEDFLIYKVIYQSLFFFIFLGFF